MTDIEKAMLSVNLYDDDQFRSITRAALDEIKRSHAEITAVREEVARWTEDEAWVFAANRILRLLRPADQYTDGDLKP